MRSTLGWIASGRSGVFFFLLPAASHQPAWERQARKTADGLRRPAGTSSPWSRRARKRTLSKQRYHDKMESQEWATSIVQDGDSSWLVVVGDVVSPSISARVHTLQRAVETLHPAWLVETVPGYCSLALIVQPFKVSLEEVE